MRSILLALALVGCRSIETSHDFDPAYDFSTVETYAFVDPSRERPEDPLSYQRIVDAVDAELGARGFVRSTEAPDVYLVVRMSSDTEVYVNDWGYTYPPFGLPVRDVDVHQREVGVMVLDVADAEARRVVWRGTARGPLYVDGSPQSRQARIQEAVADVLAAFPPGS